MVRAEPALHIVVLPVILSSLRSLLCVYSVRILPILVFHIGIFFNFKTSVNPYSNLI